MVAIKLCKTSFLEHLKTAWRYPHVRIMTLQDWEIRERDEIKRKKFTGNDFSLLFITIKVYPHYVDT